MSILFPGILAPRPSLPNPNLTGPRRCAASFPEQTSHLPRSSARPHGLAASKTNLVPGSRGRRRCRHITACAAKCVREEVCAGRGGRGLGRKSGFLRPGARRQAVPDTTGAAGRAAGPGATRSRPNSPETSAERRLPRPSRAPRLRPSPWALPALVTRGPRHRTPRRHTPSRLSPAPPRTPLLRGPGL